MRISVAEAASTLEARGIMKRHFGRINNVERIIGNVSRILGRQLPTDLEEFYREGIGGISDAYVIAPEWNDRVGWRTPDAMMTELLHVQAIPLFGDGCGNIYGLDLAAGEATAAVYFFNHERNFECEWAAGSSLGSFLLLLADDDRAYRENWPEKWQLAIDPDIDDCPRARAIWAAG